MRRCEQSPSWNELDREALRGLIWVLVRDRAELAIREGRTKTTSADNIRCNR